MSVLIKISPGPNPLKGWQVDPAAIRHLGTDLQRPECILAERDGTLWAADARGGVTRIDPDGTQALITQQVSGHFDLASDPERSLLQGTLPNGLAFAGNGDLLIANFGTDRLERMDRQGYTRTLCEQIDGRPMGKVNFVLRDRRERIWFTVSTRINPWTDALRPDLADGYIGLLDDKGPRIVADGFSFTNEIRFDAKEEWLYVAETSRKRVSRLRVKPDGSLGEREVFGPASLGAGVVDGIAFDSYGNLWTTLIFSDRLVALTPEGDALELFGDGEPNALAAFEAEFGAGRIPSREVVFATGGTTCRWLASLTFGGADLKTVYLGGLRATDIAYFQSPVAGLPMAHW